MSTPRVEQIDGRPTIRVVRRLPHPAERVWRAVSEPSELQHWFVVPVSWAPALGEEFESFGQVGRVTELDAPRVLAWEWGGESFRFEIEPAGDGCVLTFLHAFTTMAGPPEQRAAGWEIYLGRLDAYLGGVFLDEQTAHRQGIRVTEDGRPAVRFHRRLAHPIERVWRAVSEPDELGRWFPAAVHGDLRAGADLQFEMAAGPTLAGRVLALEPPRLLEFSWGDDRIRIELLRLEDGLTHLSFTHVLSEDESALARTAAGWHVCLDGLEQILDGTLDRVQLGRTGAWDAAYEAYREQGFPAGAPLPAH